MRRSLLVAVLALVLSVGIVALPQTLPQVRASFAANIISNGGFETGGLSPWTEGNPAGWVIENSVVHSGAYAAEAQSSGAAMTINQVAFGVLAFGGPVSGQDAFSFAVYFGDSGGVADIVLGFVGLGGGSPARIDYWLTPSASSNVANFSANPNYLFLNQPVGSWIVVTRNVSGDLGALGLTPSGFALDQVGAGSNMNLAPSVIEYFDDFSYVAPAVNVTIQVAPLNPPPQFAVSVDGQWITTPQTFQWAVGSQHAVTAQDSLMFPYGSGYAGLLGLSWSDGGAQTHTVTVGSVDETITANYASVQYSISIGTLPGSVPLQFMNVTCSPGGFWVDPGASVSCAANVGSGFRFDHWTFDNQNLTANPLTFTMDAPHGGTAYFGTEYLILSGPTGQGFVTVDGQPAASPLAAYWLPGATHTVAANSPVVVGDTTYTFVGWSDGGAQTHSVTVPQYFPWVGNGADPAPLYLFAAYSASSPAQFTMTTSVQGIPGQGSPGSVYPTSMTYANGTSVLEYAAANQNFAFDHWTLDGQPAGASNPLQVAMSQNRDLVAVFDYVPPDTGVRVTVTSDPSALGWVSVDGQPINAPQTYDWTPGSQHSLSAVPFFVDGMTNYTFVGWSDGGAQSHSITVPGGAVTFTALYNSQPAAQPPTTVQVTVASGPEGSGFVSVDGAPVSTPHMFAWLLGSTHTLSASSPVNGYVFQSWSDGGAQTHTVTITSTNAAYTTFAARFQAPAQPSSNFDFTLSASPSSLTVSPGGRTLTNVTVGTTRGSGTVALSASAATGFTFMFENPQGAAPFQSALAIAVSSSVQPGVYSVTVTGQSGSASHTATVQVTVSVSGPATGTTSRAGIIEGFGNPTCDSYAPLSGATYTAVSVSTGQRYTDTTGGDGYFNVTMPAGSYIETATRSGFKPASDFFSGGSESYAIAGFTLEGQSCPGQSSGGSTAVTGNVFTIALTPTNATVQAGGSAQFFVVVASGPSSSIGLAVSAPSGWNATVSPQSGEASGLLNSVLTVNVPASASGTHSVSVTASAPDGRTASGSVSVTVTGSQNSRYYALYVMAAPSGYGTVQVSPAGVGSVTVNGTTFSLYPAGAVVNVTAVPASGKVFSYWLVGGHLPPVSPLRVTVSATAYNVVVAVFVSGPSQSGVSVTVTSNPTGNLTEADGIPVRVSRTFVWQPGSGHTVSASGGFIVNSTARYLFAGWSDNSSAIHTFIVPNRTTTLTANYQLQYRLSASAGTGGRFATAPSGWYDNGTQVQVTAVSDPGAVFSGWTLDGQSAGGANTVTVTMSSPHILQAAFRTVGVEVTVTSNPAGSGFVVVDGANATTPVTFAWTVGSQHTLDALSPASANSTFRYIFSSWSDGENATHAVTVSGSPITYMAVYQSQFALNVSASPQSGGTVSPQSGYYDSSSTVNVQASPASGQTLSGWLLDGQDAGAANTVTVTMTTPHNLIAVFRATAVPTVPITFTTVPSQPGAASLRVDGIYVPSPYTLHYAVGSTHTVSAVSPVNFAGTLYVFQSWSDGGSQTHKVTVSTAATFTARYAAQAASVQVVVSSSPATIGLVTVDGAPIATPQTFTWPAGSSHSLTATPPSGYVFTGWSDGDRSASRTVVASGASYVADFVLAASPSALVTVTSIPTGFGYVQVDGTLITTPRIFNWTVGSVHELSAAPAMNGQVFQSWSDMGTQTRTVVVTGAASYAADFQAAPAPPTSGGLAVSANPPVVTVSPGGSAATTLTVSSSGQVILSVSSGDGITVSLSVTQGSGTFTVRATVAAAATVKPGTYGFTVTAQDGSLTGSASVQVNVPGSSSGVTLTLSPSYGAVQPGGSTSFLAELSGSSSDQWTVNATGQDGVTVSVAAPSCGVPCSVQVDVTTGPSVAAGQYEVYVSASDGQPLYASFLLTVESPQTPESDFQIVASEKTVAVAPNGTAGFDVAVVPLSGSGVVALAASGLPSGVSAVFDNASGATPFTSHVTLTADGAARAGGYNFTVTGESGQFVHSVPVALIVGAEKFSVSVTVDNLTVQAGGYATSEVLVSGGFYPANVSLTANVTESGIAVSFAPASGLPAYSSAMNVTVAASVPAGHTYGLTVVGTAADGTTASVFVAVTVTAASAPGDCVLGRAYAGTVVCYGRGFVFVWLVAVAGLVVIWILVHYARKKRRPESPAETEAEGANAGAEQGGDAHE